VQGLVPGSLLVFIPAVGEFVIPALLGGPEQLMIGKVLWTEFFSNRDWPVARAVAIALLMLLLIPIALLQRAQPAEARGTYRWLETPPRSAAARWSSASSSCTGRSCRSSSIRSTSHVW